MKKTLLMTGLTLALMLAACAPAATPAPTLEPTALPTEAPTATPLPTEAPVEPALAVIERVEVQPGMPTTAVVVSGTLPSACAQLDVMGVMLRDRTFTVTLASTISPAMICTMDVIPFKVEIPLNTAHFEAGTYTVEVNGKAQTFELSAEANMEAPVITLERTVCFGVCPVYKLAIYADGRVVYTGIDFVETKGEQTGSISAEQMQELTAAFQAAKFFDLKDEYRAPVTDLPSTITLFTWEGQTKVVLNYGGCMIDSPEKAPQALCDLEQQIDEVTQSAQWIGEK